MPERHLTPEKEAPVLHKNMVHASFLVYLTIMGAVAAQAQEAAPAIPPVPRAITAAGGGDEAGHGQTPVLQHRNSRYQLHSSDVLELSFPFTPEFNQAVTIQPDGYITLRSVESIKVDGKTIPELVDLLRSTYAKILHDPVINVELKDFEKPYFIVGGEVGHPGTRRPTWRRMPTCKPAISCSCQKTRFPRSRDLFRRRQSVCIRTQSCPSPFFQESEV